MPLRLKPLRKIKTKIVIPPKVGEIVEGTLVGFERGAVFLDLGAKGIGIIYGVEFYKAKDILKNLKIGDKVTAKVLDLETEEGYRELSLVEASQEVVWKELKELKEKGEEIELKVEKANKGGLIGHLKGIQAFLPVSQLAPQNYPKIEDANPAKIAQALQKFIGKTLKVKILDLDPSKGKLILSEKIAIKEREETPSVKYQVGEIVEGKISGITNFGAFVQLDETTEGLLYPSEIPETKKEIIQKDAKVKAKVIEIKEGKVYLSLKNVE